MTAITTGTKSDRRGSRKTAAVLAGGLVLGVGIMATVTSWNDSESAPATFTASQFTVEGAADQATANSTVTQAATSTVTWQFQAASS